MENGIIPLRRIVYTLRLLSFHHEAKFVRKKHGCCIGNTGRDPASLHFPPCPAFFRFKPCFADKLPKSPGKRLTQTTNPYIL
ncbi:hypothetical protein EGS38_06950 [Neisseria chenwenguii]|nr:hypothetical protein EGS38_06950 [Neisseria chenwenguii]